MSNSIIDVGQSTTFNTVISKGVGPYAGEWTFVPTNWSVTGAPTALGTNPSYVAFDPNGPYAYVTNYGSGTVNVISTVSNAVVKTINVGTNPNGVAFNPNGTVAYVTNYGSGTVNVISVGSNSVINTITVGTNPASVVFNPMGTLAYVTNYGSNSVNVISVASNTVVNTISVGNNPYGIIFNPQGTLLYVTGYSSGTVNVISVATNSIVNTIIVGSHPYYSAINPQGTLMYVTNYGSGTVNIINTATDKIVNTITVGTNPKYVAFNPAGTIAYVANYGSNTLSIIDILTSLTVNTVKVGTNPQAVAFSPSGTIAYVTNYGSASMNVILPHETAVTPLPTSSNALTLTVNTVSSNTISLAFNGVVQSFTAAGSGTLPGNWIFYGFGEDNTSVLSSQTGTNQITTYNTLQIDPQPTANQLMASNVVLGAGQTTTFNVLISGGQGPFTVNLIASNGIVVNTITGAAQGIVTFGPITPPAGPQSYNVIGIDQGTTTPYTFNSVSNTITGYGTACFISLSTAAVSFGGINPNSNVPTTNVIIDTNSGTVPAAFLIAGGVGDSNSWYDNGIWVDTTTVNTIGIANTLWSLTSQSGYAGTALTNVLTTTGISIAASSSNSVYLGMQIPGGTPTGGYTTNIVIENSC
jgi:YVTN family beta-propeller protein